MDIKNKLKKNREFSTETLIDVNYDPEDVRDFDSGKAPVSRETQHAEKLEDLVEFQKHSRGHDDAKNTHRHRILDAVKDYNPDAGREKKESEKAYGFNESPGSGFKNSNISKDSNRANESEETGETNEPSKVADSQTGSYGETSLKEAVMESLANANDSSSAEDDTAAELDNLSKEYEPRPLRPGDVGYEDIMGQFTSAPTKPKYWFEEFEDYWSCSCGKLNKGDYCTNCGLTRDLLRSLFFLHKPGIAPGEYEGMPVKFEEVIVPKGRLSSKQKLMIAIIAMVILLASACVFSYFYIFVPAQEREAAKVLKANTESLCSNISKCVSESDNFLWNSYVSAGDTCLEDKRYEDALRFYAKAQQINNTGDLKDKVLEAKYRYVKAKKSDGGSTFEKYLGELMAAGYEDVKKIYDEFYAWHFKIVTNTSPDDYATDISTASRADIIYFHVTTSGGPPENSISVYYEAVWPSGAKQTDLLGSNWTDGSKGYAKFAYPVPILAQEGTLTFKIYNKSTQELLGSDSVSFKH